MHLGTPDATMGHEVAERAPQKRRIVLIVRPSLTPSLTGANHRSTPPKRRWYCSP